MEQVVSVFFKKKILSTHVDVGVVMGRLRLPHQPDPPPCAGAHGHWKVLPSCLHCVFLRECLLLNLLTHPDFCLPFAALLPWDHSFNANILCGLPANVLQRTHGGK